MCYQVCNYTSDITTTFPVNGKFTEKQKQIYELVLGINRKILSVLKPGVKWMDMENLCSEMLLQGLIKLGFVTGDIKELMEKNVSLLFMPHGLGHFIVFNKNKQQGLDTHDVGRNQIDSVNFTNKISSSQGH